MSAETLPAPCPPYLALENAAFTLGLRPTGIHAVLLPVWSVQVRAKVTEAQPYDLIDRFVERGIAEAGLATAGEVASFLALDPALVAQALAFLTAIDHVTEEDGRLGLTALGRRSVKDGKRYTVTHDDRRSLYFDGFRSGPLTTAHYRNDTVVRVPHDGAAAGWHRGPRPHRLMAHPFRDEAVRELADDPGREGFNLPAGVDGLERVGAPECLHLPAYVVRAAEDDGRTRHLVYTRAHDGEHDVLLSAACEQTPECVHALRNEELAAARSVERRITGWLSDQDLGQFPPVRDAQGAWRVTLPRERVGAGGPVGLHRIGGFVVLGGSFFQFWCEDRDTRAWALVERLDRQFGARLRHDPAGLRARVDSLSRQLELGQVDLEALRRAATAKGKHGLAERLRAARLNSRSETGHE
ncbi:hypothetical protein [Streptomyces adustus]|uniref:hypothetical protein n=1 Tax=Streptomyces adustus TaxID=1609272 RepID=UPI0012DFFECD|nr:hypothetical protein [Streptomyces adustus]